MLGQRHLCLFDLLDLSVVEARGGCGFLQESARSRQVAVAKHARGPHQPLIERPLPFPAFVAGTPALRDRVGERSGAGRVGVELARLLHERLRFGQCSAGEPFLRSAQPFLNLPGVGRLANAIEQRNRPRVRRIEVGGLFRLTQRFFQSAGGQRLVGSTEVMLDLGLPALRQLLHVGRPPRMGRCRRRPDERSVDDDRGFETGLIELLPDAPDLAPHHGEVLVSRRRILLDCALDNPGDGRVELRQQARQRHRLLGDDALGDGDRRVAGERLAAGQQLVDHQTERRRCRSGDRPAAPAPARATCSSACRRHVRRGWCRRRRHGRCRSRGSSAGPRCSPSGSRA